VNPDSIKAELALDVNLQEVVPIQPDAADGCCFADAGMGSMVVVVVEPSFESVFSLFGVLVGFGVGPFPE
jgi:hypothetical protein